MEVKLTPHEQKVVNYLQLNSNRDIAWQELAQFAKDPTTVKLSTIQKTVSEIKRKFVNAERDLPFKLNLKNLIKDTKPQEQVLVQLKRTPGGNVVKATDMRRPVQIDFTPDPLGFRKVKTKNGMYQLNDNEWDMFKYFYNNPERIIPISELRDKVVFPNYGSKLPARWFDSIMRTINALRRQVLGINHRLHTVKGDETSYLFQ